MLFRSAKERNRAHSSRRVDTKRSRWQEAKIDKRAAEEMKKMENGRWITQSPLKAREAFRLYLCVRYMIISLFSPPPPYELGSSPCLTCAFSASGSAWLSCARRQVVDSGRDAVKEEPGIDFVLIRNMVL